MYLINEENRKSEKMKENNKTHIKNKTQNPKKIEIISNLDCDPFVT
jgi:hypothetical protein